MNLPMAKRIKITYDEKIDIIKAMEESIKEFAKGPKIEWETTTFSWNTRKKRNKK